ncbi:MAG: hypothetical protein P1P88_16535 [Bacteroidales bacterium]|nr:hypothetical protein [Bacteroidales bacterium]
MKIKLTAGFLIGMIMFFAESFLENLSAQTTHEVAVSNFKFEPANLSIAVGDIVTELPF